MITKDIYLGINGDISQVIAGFDEFVVLFPKGDSLYLYLDGYRIISPGCVTRYIPCL